MNKFTQKELEQIISLYIDGELEIDEMKKFEEYLTTQPSLEKEVEVLRYAKKTLSSKQKLPNNDWFWLKFSNTIEARKIHKGKFISSSRPSFKLVFGTAFTIFVIGIIYFKDAPLFSKFFVEKKQQVENSLMSGNILPLFANLDKDDALNFALFGSILIDSEKNTTLQVKDTEDKGSQIQIVQKKELNQTPTVTVSDFCDEVGIEIPQQQVVDTILGTYKQKLLASVLVSENKEIAIHEQLAGLNRAVVSTIAASLEPVQRIRFKKFLEDRHAPYAVVAVNAPQIPSNEIFKRIPRFEHNNRYVVISKDTVGIAEMKMNMDSIRESVRRHHFAARRVVNEQMLREIVELRHHFEHNLVIAGQNSNRVRVYSTENAFQINLESSPAFSEPTDIVEMVKPRFASSDPSAKMEKNSITSISDSTLTFELPTDNEALQVFKRLPSGEFRFDILDSGTKSSKIKMTLKYPAVRKKFDEKLKEMNNKDQQLIDLDSLLRESDQKSMPSENKEKKLYEL